MQVVAKVRQPTQLGPAVVPSGSGPNLMNREVPKSPDGDLMGIGSVIGVVADPGGSSGGRVSLERRKHLDRR